MTYERTATGGAFRMTGLAPGEYSREPSIDLMTHFRSDSRRPIPTGSRDSRSEPIESRFPSATGG